MLWPVLALSVVLNAPPAQNGAISKRAAELHRSAILVDGHADTTLRLVDENFDLKTVTPVSEGHFDLSKAREGNVGAQFFSIWVEPKAHEGRYAHRTLQMIDAVLRQVEKHPDELVLTVDPAGIEQARRGPKKKLAVLLGVEGGHSIEDDLGLLRAYHRLGVRYMTLTWSNSNGWADSSGDADDPKVKRHGGLTDFGREVVREMNRLGMLVDVSHVSDETFVDVLEVTRAPVIASHSSARALTSHPRNMTDEMLRAVAKNGGVVMVNFNPPFVDQKYLEETRRLAPERRKAAAEAEERLRAADPKTRARELNRLQKEWAARIPRPPFASLIDHIDHIAKVAGVDHVGLGSDFDGILSLPDGIDSAADLPRITEALLQRGWAPADVRKILGGNFLRVFRQVEAVGKKARLNEASGAKTSPAAR